MHLLSQGPWVCSPASLATWQGEIRREEYEQLGKDLFICPHHARACPSWVYGDHALHF